MAFNETDVFCVAGRNVLHRIMGLPENPHSYLFLPVINDSLPMFDEIGKRSAWFILSCLSSPSSHFLYTHLPSLRAVLFYQQRSQIDRILALLAFCTDVPLNTIQTNKIIIPHHLFGRSLGTVPAVAKHDSVLHSNALFCCERFNWSSNQFIAQSVVHSNSFFYRHYKNGVSETKLSTALLLLEFLLLREQSITSS